MGRRSETRLIGTAWLVGILAVGIALRALCMNQSLFGDELWTLGHVTKGGLDGVFTSMDVALGQNTKEKIELWQQQYGFVPPPEELNPPGYFILAWIFSQFVDPDTGIRLPSLLAGIGTIPLTFLLGKELFNRRLGAYAAALVAVSPLLIFESVEARAYALATLLVLVSTYALVKAVKSGANYGWWVLYSLTAAAALYTQYVAVFILAAQFGWALWWKRDHWRPLIASNLAVAVLLIPLAPTVRGDVTSPWVSALSNTFQLSLKRVIEIPLQWATANPLIPPQSWLLLTLAGLGVALAVAGWIEGRPRRTLQKEGQCGNAALILLLALAAPVGCLIAAVVGADMTFAARNMTSSWPGLALLLAAAVTIPRSRLSAAAAVLILGSVTVMGFLTLSPGDRRPDFRGAAAYAERNASRGSAIFEFGPIKDSQFLPRQCKPYSPSGAFCHQLSRPQRTYQSCDAEKLTSCLRPRGNGNIIVVDESGGSLRVTGSMVPNDFRLARSKTFEGSVDIVVTIYEKVPGKRSTA